MKKRYLTALLIGAMVCGVIGGCGNSQNKVSLASTNESPIETTVEAENNSDEDFEIEYTVNEDGTYTCEGQSYKYKKEVIEGDMKFTVLTNDEDITFEKVFSMLISSSIGDITETIIIDEQVISE